MRHSGTVSLGSVLCPCAHATGAAPLRTRPEDLEQAIDMCLDDCVTRLDRYVVLTKESRRVLMEYPWPGNYIQMKAFLERMVLTTSTRTVHGEYVRRLLEQLYPAPVRDRLSPAEMEARSPEEAALLEALRQPGRRGSRAGYQQDYPLAADEAVWVDQRNAPLKLAPY